MKGLEGGKEQEKCCNYTIISKIIRKGRSKIRSSRYLQLVT